MRIRILRTLAAALALAAPAVVLAQSAAPESNSHVGHDKTALCEGCHGIAGYRTAYPKVYHVPKLGGQQAGYIVSALTAYKEGHRSHPSMDDIARTLSQKDMEDVAAYYSSRTPPAGGRELLAALSEGESGNAALGKEKAAQVCAACHGADGAKPSAPDQPILAGQYEDYLVKALTDYKTGKRSNPIMKAFAGQLSKEDIENVAAWFSSQHSRLHFQR